MSERITLKSFADLATVPGLLARDDSLDTVTDRSPDTVTDGPAAQPQEPGEPALSLTDLLHGLEQAATALAAAIGRDEETRALALRELDRYDAAVAGHEQAAAARERARQLRREAAALAAAAFTEEARAAAEHAAAVADHCETAAAVLAGRHRAEAAGLAARLDLERLLAERRRAAAAAQAHAAAAAQARRLSDALAETRAAFAAGRTEAAAALLDPLQAEHPDNAEVASLVARVRRRQLADTIRAAEDALWLARRDGRRDPAAAAARLAALPVDALPAELARQVFGAWARACARLCRERQLAEPLRYAPDPGRGAVFARERPGAPYVVVSALGLGPAWQAGRSVSEQQLRRARPLR